MRTYGLTGGIGTGKSTVSKMLKEKGATIVDADEIAKQVAEEEQVLAKIRQVFSDEVFDNHILNRKKLGEIVFNNAYKKRQLEDITHPLIFEEIKAQIEASSTITIVDVPLLFETSAKDFLEKVIVVYVPFSVQLERVMRRDGVSLKEATKRIDSQLSMQFKLDHATHVINNGQSIYHTQKLIDTLWEQL